MEPKHRIIRPRLTKWELGTIRRLVDDEYRRMKRNIRWYKKRKWDPQVYPISLQEKHKNMMGRLLKKLNRLIYGKFKINP